MQHPVFAPYRDEIAALDIAALDRARQMPSLAALNALAEARGLVNAAARPLRFTLPPDDLSARDYETLILQTGTVPTRAHNWHDLMNALVWLRFPRFKAALNTAHVAAMDREASPVRGSRRDALTLLDESGVWMLADEHEWIELLQAREWRTLFWDRRENACANVRFVVVGHALLEKMRAPYPAITGKCLRLPTAVCKRADASLECAEAQAVIALGSLDAPRQMAPLPLLGIPGWDPANATAAYYENSAVFRR